MTQHRRISRINKQWRESVRDALAYDDVRFDGFEDGGRYWLRWSSPFWSCFGPVLLAAPWEQYAEAVRGIAAEREKRRA